MSLTSCRIPIYAVFLLSLLASRGEAQRIAILVPNETELDKEIAERLVGQLGSDLRVDDLDLSRTAAAAAKYENAFNLRTSEARTIGQLLGTQHFLIISAAVQRRTSLSESGYFEAWAVVYIVGSSSGELIDWKLFSQRGPSQNESVALLIGSIDEIAGDVKRSLCNSKKTEKDRSPDPRFQPVPDDEEPGWKGLRPPMPYKRVSPVYTEAANLYGIRASVEIEADIDADGAVKDTDITRWAGYGLDESVEKTVRGMNWRAASLSGRSLPMRVLLRYNFVELKNDGPN